MAIKLAITRDGSESHVWAMLDDRDHNQNPTTRGEAFVIGSGETLRQALELAREDLQKATGDIEVMLYDIAAGDPNPSIEGLVR